MSSLVEFYGYTSWGWSPISNNFELIFRQNYFPDTLDFTPASVIQAEPGKPISFDVSVPASSDISPSDASGIGPPKALLRWQRRPRSQYGEETEEVKEQSKAEIKAEFTSEVSKPVQKAVTHQSVPKEEVEQEIRPTVTPRTRLDLSREIKKMEEWDRQQEEQRQVLICLPLIHPDTCTSMIAQTSLCCELDLLFLRINVYLRKVDGCFN